MLLEKDERKVLFKRSGGGGGIRTLDTVTRITVFETVPFNHSGTPPHAQGT